MATVLLTLLVLLALVPAAAQAANPITVENAQPGTTAWRLGQDGAQVATDAGGQIKGYASKTSVNRGEQITFKVSVAPVQEYTISIYRVGCYPNAAGTCLGGRFMTELGPIAGQTQTACPLDGPSGANTGLIECNWSGPTFTVPTTWTSGVYLAVLTNDQNFQNYIQFVVRDDARHSALLYQQPVMNYQAYNAYPWYGDGDARNGKSLYDNRAGGPDTVAGAGRPRAVKVSFDRPYSGDGAGELLDENGWSWEGYFIRWMEQHGYDVAYSTNFDTHQHPERMLDHQGWISVGHDEYWTKQMFDGAEAARDAGIHLGFFGANDIYWQVRLEPNATGQNDRTMVVYKNSPNNTYLTNDPNPDPALKTVRFQDPPVNRPAQTLLGQSFQSSTGRSTLNTDFKVMGTDHWAYAGSGFTAGAQVPGIVGYETDQYSCHYPMPQNTSYTMLGSSPFRDADGYVAPSNASIYRALSGAWVFDAGTMSWSWALDRPGYVDPRIQKTTENLLEVFSGQRTPVAPATSFEPDCSDHRSMTFEGGSLTSDPGPGATGGDRTLGAATLETAAPISGAFSLSVPNVGNAYVDTHLTPTDDTDVTASIRLRALPAADVRVVSLSSMINNSGNLLLRANGQLCLRFNNAWAGGVPGNSCTVQPLELGKTYRMRIHQVRGTGADGVLEGFVAEGSAPFGAAFVSTLTGTWTTMVDRLSVGTTTAQPLDAVFDDISVDGVALAVPSAPTGLSAVPPASATAVDLTWTDTSANESSMVVERSASSGFQNLTAVTLPRGTTSYRDTTVANATAYWYRVRAANAAGPSTASNPVTVTTRPPPPAAPTALVATWTSAVRTSLRWNDNAGSETGYVVERAGNAAFNNAVTIPLPPDSTQYDDGPLPEGPYFYRVRADNGLSSSAYTNVATGPRIKDMTFEDGRTDLLDPDTGATRNAGGLVVRESAAPLRGNYSARVPDLGNAYLEQTLGGSDDFYASFYIRIATRPTNDQRIAQVLNGTATIANLWVRSSTGQLCLKYGNAWSGGSVNTGCTPTASPLQDNRLYRIALRQRRGDGSSDALVQAFWSANDTGIPAGQTGALRMFTTASVPTTDLGYWTTRPSAFRIGATLNATPLNAIIDNVKLDAAFMPSDDLLRPASSASSPPYSTAAAFPVAYSTQDQTGAGVARVDLYAKGPGDLAYSLAGTTASPGATGSFAFVAPQDGGYSFYTVATDANGFAEPTSSGQSTTVVDTLSPSSSASSPALARGPVQVGYSVADGGSGPARVDLLVKRPGEAAFAKVASRTPDGASGEFTYTPDGGDGRYEFATVAADRAGNEESEPAAADAATVFDASAPTSAATAAAFSAQTAMTIYYTAQDATSEIQRVDLYVRAPGASDYTKAATATGASGSFAYTAANGEGPYRFYTVAVDTAGNAEDAPAAPDVTTVLDSTAPDSSATAPVRSRTAAFAVDYTASDGGSGLVRVDLYARAPGEAAYAKVASRNGAAASGSFSYTATGADGAYRFYTVAVDAAGVEEPAPAGPDASVDLDRAAPTSASSSPATVFTTAIPVGYTTTDPGAGTGVTQLDLYVRAPGQATYAKVATVNNPAASGSIAYTALGGNGSYAFYTLATDRAGNTETAPATPDSTTTVALDASAPASAAGALALYTSAVPLAIPYTASDTGSAGLAAVELWVRAPGAATYSLATTTNTPGASGNLAYTPTVDGLYRFYTRATDRAGNREAAPAVADASTTVDRVAPTAFSMNTPANAAGYVSGTESMTLATAPTDPDSGVLNVRYQYAPTGTATWTDACVATASPWSCNWNTSSVLQRGYDLRATATDRAGNVRVATNAPLPAIVDNTRPTTAAIATTNRAGGTAGRAESGDSVIFTFSERVSPASVLAGWTGAATPVQLVIVNNTGTPGDRVEVWNSALTARLAVTASNGLALGGDYATGSGAAFNATMTQSNAVITVTLGTLSGGTLRVGAASGGTLVWTPDARTADLAGNLITNATVSRAGPAF